MRAIQSRFRPVSRGRALGRCHVVEVLGYRDLPGRGPDESWAVGWRATPRRPPGRFGCAVADLSVHTALRTRRVVCRTNRDSYLQLSRVRSYRVSAWNGVHKMPYPDPVALWIGSIQVSIPSEKRGVVRALFERCPYLVLFWSRGPLLSNDRSIRVSAQRTSSYLYVYLEHPASHGYQATPRHPFDPLWPPRPPRPP